MDNEKLNKLFSVNEKKIIITGSAKENGLGAEMAASMKKLGADVLLLDVDPRVETTAEKIGAKFVICDVSCADEAKKGFNEAIQQLNGLDVLVNCVGTQHRCMALDFDTKQWDRVIQVNLSAMFYMCQLAGEHMKANGYGKIINISSVSGFIGPKNMVAYAASKGGVIQMTRALSSEWSAYGINVNGIAPGTTYTDFTADIINTPQGKGMLARVPMNRFGIPEDMVGAVVFLASHASDYVSGVTIPVDGGYLAD